MIKESKHLTSQYNQWLKRGGVVDPLMQKTVHMKLLGTDNSKGGGRVRPSLLGDCLRKQVFSMNGVPVDQYPDLKSQRAFAYGNVLHRHWQEAGMTIGFLTDIEVPVSYPELQIAGSADGLCSDGSIFELKSISARQWDMQLQRRYETGEVTEDNIAVTELAPASHRVKPEHIIQTHAYMLALDTDLARIVYVRKDDWIACEFEVHRDENVITHLKQQTTDVLNGSLERLPKITGKWLESCVDGGSPKYLHDGCPWRDTCAPRGK